MNISYSTQYYDTVLNMIDLEFNLIMLFDSLKTRVVCNV